MVTYLTDIIFKFNTHARSIYYDLLSLFGKFIKMLTNFLIFLLNFTKERSKFNVYIILSVMFIRFQLFTIFICFNIFVINKI